MSEHLTPAHIILLTFALGIDEVDMDAICEHAGVSPDILFAADGMMSARDVEALSSSAQILSRDPARGLHLGEEVGLEMLDIAGMLFSTAPDLRTALRELIAHLRLISTLGQATLEEEGDQARLVMHFLDDPGLRGGFSFAEVTATTVLTIVRRLVRGDFHVREIHCVHPEPLWVAEYRRIFGEEVRFHFSAPENAAVFERRLLDLPMLRHSPGLYQKLRQQAALRLANLPQPETVAATVQRLIGEHLGERLVDLPLIADSMGLSPRTLQRRLREEGSNFVRLLEACRFRRACECLGGGEMAVEELAAHLGYSEPANFYRAFKAWAGLTPNEYRQRQRAGLAPGVAQGF